MRTLMVLSVYMVSFFPNPLHKVWPRKHHHVYSTGDIIPLVEQPPYSDPRCFNDETTVYFIEPDDSIGMGKTCEGAMENGRRIDPAIRWPDVHIYPQHKI